jgi:hypothetical protein
LHALHEALNAQYNKEWRNEVRVVGKTGYADGIVGTITFVSADSYFLEDTSGKKHQVPKKNVSLVPTHQVEDLKEKLARKYENDDEFHVKRTIPDQKHVLKIAPKLPPPGLGLKRPISDDNISTGSSSKKPTLATASSGSVENTSSGTEDGDEGKSSKSEDEEEEVESEDEEEVESEDGDEDESSGVDQKNYEEAHTHFWDMYRCPPSDTDDIKTMEYRSVKLEKMRQMLQK